MSVEDSYLLKKTMQCKKCNPFVVKPKTKTRTMTEKRVEGKGLTKANERKLILFMLKDLLN